MLFRLKRAGHFFFSCLRSHERRFVIKAGYGVRRLAWSDTLLFGNHCVESGVWAYAAQMMLHLVISIVQQSNDLTLHLSCAFCLMCNLYQVFPVN